ncbi:hypothetical protein EVAR_67081_1 [Eumeta japonica]|uniref:Uncharacterized protein n=1 Tax=Eumeta variegata TaxID=151549 RepID=A0A4C1STC2_EUMVA|nr:hypothetical protein EVAR_67081_1 [Eumeta japonica]
MKNPLRVNGARALRKLAYINRRDGSPPTQNTEHGTVHVHIGSMKSSSDAQGSIWIGIKPAIGIESRATAAEIEGGSYSERNVTKL